MNEWSYNIPAKYFEEGNDPRFTCDRCEVVFNAGVSLVFSHAKNKEVYMCDTCKQFSLLRHQIHEVQR